jgi:Hydroxyphenylpyruvate dioxygenase, HPPD, N-terminal
LTASKCRSKAIRLYRRGQINLVLDAEQDSGAGEFFHLHGPLVCAMALRGKDAERTAVPRHLGKPTDGQGMPHFRRCERRDRSRWLWHPRRRHADTKVSVVQMRLTRAIL